MIIRAATLADVDSIARVHIQAWEESYRGLIQDAAFDDYPVEKRVAHWRATLGNAEVLVYVAEHDGTVCGFGSGGKSRQLATESEIYAFYLLEAVKRRGVGRMLFAHLRAALAARGFASLGLWVLSSNLPARRFYEALGGRTAEMRIDRRGELAFEDVAYIWDDIARLS